MKLDKWKWSKQSMLETPCVVIDNETVSRNISAMATSIAQRGVSLRPHIKTHKLPEMAQRQIEAGAVGITTAKVSEAEVMAAAGIRDIFIAYPLVSESKIRRAIHLIRAGVRLMVGVDSLEGALRISQLAQLEQTSVEVRLEIDTGLQRTGVAEAEAIPIAKEISRMNGVDLTGIFTFRGPVLHGSPTRDIRSAGHDEGKVLAALARKLRDASVPIKEVSAGSTQTAIYAAEIDGITEVRPGTYIYHDRMQVEFGVCKIEDCAGAVFTTVVSRPAKDRIVVDAGSKAFATDVQPGQPPLYLSGFGHVIGDPTAIFERMNEEHGVITIHPDASYKVGDVIAIIPNHICSTVNLHNAMYIKEASGELRKMAIPARGMLD